MVTYMGKKFSCSSTHIVFLISILSSLTIFISSASAHHVPTESLSNWSFLLHPYPEEKDYTEAERTLLLNDTVGSCLNRLELELDVYESRYPKFRALGTTDQRARAWRLYLVRNQAGPYPCANDYTPSKLIDLELDPDFQICGPIPRSLKAEEEHEAVELYEELITLIGLGRGAARLMLEPAMKDIFKLHPDAEYFARRTIKILDPTDVEMADVRHLVGKIEPERLKELDAAVEQLDYRYVIRTIGEC